ncbi:MAG: hypothetical protein NTW08_06715 [Gammaproteobacteria bacterium]|nr:hypothetical protein [Gammaproteobacteria bacterium]
MAKEKGVVLILVLLMLSAMLLLTLSQWQGIAVYQKIIGQVAKNQPVLLTLEKTMRSQWSAYQSQLTPSEGIQELNAMKIGYRVVEKGSFACVRQDLSGVPLSTAHVEIQTWLVEHPEHRLIVRLARPIPLQPCATEQVRLVSNAVLSWQYD